MDRAAIYAGDDLSDAEIAAAKKLLKDHALPDGHLTGCTSYLQRKMQIPYSHARRIVELLEVEQFVTPCRANGTRALR